MAPLKKLLLINPNSSKTMTDGLEPLIKDLSEQGINQTFEIVTYTAPSGPPSINNEDDAHDTAMICIADLNTKLSQYDAFLVACYSVHPLVTMLKSRVPPHVHVTGIFEASITTSLSLLPKPRAGAGSNENVYEKFGIVSTGTYWEEALSNGVLDFMGIDELKNCHRFKGVQTTGLNADELHTAPAELVRTKMIEATKRLVKDRDVRVICLGCAGMAGMDDTVQEALVEELGEAAAKKVYIVDGVKVGIGLLESLVRALPKK
ncbi:hydantoin racemase [Phlyctema vagabunda]|uniref:Hydantoin racemase n=1 Tax=Phlyctema vagabunda TaxID=108571 RepID=A0ABR4PHQ7_9HELO